MKNAVTFAFGYCQAHCLPTRIPQLDYTKATPYKITIILRAAFRLPTQEEYSQVFLLPMTTIEEPADLIKHADYPANLVLPEYHAYLPLFTKKGADKLPTHKYVDHEILLKAEKKPLMGWIYSISTT